MESLTVPCARCDEFRARFEAEGFTVLGCDAHPTRTGMCVLNYERPTAMQKKGTE